MDPNELRVAIALVVFVVYMVGMIAWLNRKNPHW